MKLPTFMFLWGVAARARFDPARRSLEEPSSRQLTRRRIVRSANALRTTVIAVETFYKKSETSDGFLIEDDPLAAADRVRRFSGSDVFVARPCFLMRLSSDHEAGQISGWRKNGKS